jgi:hypothetical protein
MTIAETPRLRGRRAVEQRKRRLAKEPLCRHCRAKGFVTEATVPDHIVPLAFGGSDEDSNIQCLCDECHKVKSAIESASHEGASTHPDWIMPSSIPLTIVCGPPCSGKTTYVREHAGSADTIIDVDAIAASINPSYKPWEGMLEDLLFRQTIRARNAMLGSLDRKAGGKAWFIVSAPSPKEREWWQSKLGGTVVLLSTDPTECKRRALVRGTPKAIEGIDDWMRKAKEPWHPPIHKPTIGLDGWPEE